MRETDPDRLIDNILTYREAMDALRSQPRTKPELEEVCDVSRSTIDRWISRLEAAGFVHRPNDRFRLTLFGQIVALKFARLRSQIDQLARFREPITALSDTIEVAPEVFETADISVYRGLAPEFAEDLLSRPGSVRLITPHLSSVFSLFMFVEPDPDVEVEVVVREEVFSQLETQFANRRLPLLSVASAEVYGGEDVPPFGLALVEREGSSRVYLLFEGPEAEIGVIECDSPEAVEWGEAVYRKHRSRAEQCELSHLSQPFGALRDRHQRVILMGVLNGDVEHENDVILRDSSGGSHESLATLEEMEYIEWDRDTGEVSRGPRFERIEPVLELFVDHVGMNAQG